MFLVMRLSRKVCKTLKWRQLLINLKFMSLKFYFRNPRKCRVIFNSMLTNNTCNILCLTTQWKIIIIIMLTIIFQNRNASCNHNTFWYYFIANKHILLYSFYIICIYINTILFKSWKNTILLTMNHFNINPVALMVDETRPHD